MASHFDKVHFVNYLHLCHCWQALKTSPSQQGQTDCDNCEDNLGVKVNSHLQLLSRQGEWVLLSTISGPHPASTPSWVHNDDFP